MKALQVIILFSVFTCLMNAQQYNGEYYTFFDYQQPDARSEALGKMQVVLLGSPISATYNPASSAFSEGLNVQYNYLNSRYFYSGLDPKQCTYGISYNSKKKMAIAFNVQSYSDGEYINTVRDVNTPSGYRSYGFTPKRYKYSINSSYMAAKDFSFGLNINYFEDNYRENGKTGAWFFDLGLLKRFRFEYETEVHNLIIGASVTNVTYSQISVVPIMYAAKSIYTPQPTAIEKPGSVSDVRMSESTSLPTNYRIGASYDYETKLQISGYRIFKVLALGEFSYIAKSNMYTTLKGGAELTFFEMLKLRMGYYSEKVSDSPNNELMKEYISQFTYGLGIYLPFKKIFNVNIPFSFQFDFASLEALSGYNNYSIDKNYNVYNFIIGYSF